MTRAARLHRRALASAAALLATACASGPPPPDWQMNARGAIDSAVAAYLEGNTRVETAEFARARSEIARSGRIDLLARAELMRCAARVASLVFDACEEFDKLRSDAPAAERAYADYLAARLPTSNVALLPAQHRAAASATAESAAATLNAIDDPLSRLIAAGVLLQGKRASPDVLQIAVDAASAQGWRRPLLAWLNLQLLRAEQAGDSSESERLRRRIGIVQKERW